jgi:hypothetical protein
VTGIQIKSLTTFKNLSLVERPFLTQIQGFKLEEAFWQHFKKLSAEVNVACQEHVTPLHK